MMKHEAVAAPNAVMQRWVEKVADVERFDVPIGNSPQRGPQDAAVTIIEFLDFQ